MRNYVFGLTSDSSSKLDSDSLSSEAFSELLPFSPRGGSSLVAEGRGGNVLGIAFGCEEGGLGRIGGTVCLSDLRRAPSVVLRRIWYSWCLLDGLRASSALESELLKRDGFSRGTVGMRGYAPRFGTFVMVGARPLAGLIRTP